MDRRRDDRRRPPSCAFITRFVDVIDHPRHEIALPPLEFMWGVGSSGETPEETIEGYLEVGTASRRDVERALGPDWDWTGRRNIPPT